MTTLFAVTILLAYLLVGHYIAVEYVRPHGRLMSTLVTLLWPIPVLMAVVLTVLLFIVDRR